MNVFVILADSFRADHLGCYGNEWIKTPNLDAFAAEATLFEQAYSEDMPTLPNRQALFTGRFCLPFRAWQALDMEHVLADAMWDSGMRTCFVTDTYHMHKPGMMFGRGFEEAHFIRGQEYDPALGPSDTPVDVDRFFKHDGTPAGDDMAEKTALYLRNRAHWQNDEDHFVAQCVRETLGWLGRMEARGKRDGLFLWLDSFDPHEPWDPMPPFDTMYGPLWEGSRQLANPIPRLVEGYLSDDECTHIQQQYAGLCSVVDKWVGILLQELRERGYFENSLIVFTTDHGEPLGNGKWGHGLMRKARPWPYEELSHIPLMIRHPEVGHGRRVGGFVQPCDLTATLLDFMQLPPMPGQHGETLLPMVRGEQDSIRDFAISGFHKASWSIRTEESTLVLWRPELGESRIPEHSVGAALDPQRGVKRLPAEPELYHRAEDPYELNNLAPERPDEAARLEVKLRRFMESLVWE